MTTHSAPKTTRRDVATIRRALYRLTAMQKLFCLALIVIAAFIGWAVLTRLVAFGQGVDYSSLQVLGDDTIAVLQQYNPFFWWGLAIIFLLLLIYILMGFVAATQRQVRNRLVSTAMVQHIVSQLSDAGRQVLEWAWQDRREPISVGVLQTALLEMRTDRASKLSLAHEHAHILGAAPAQPQTNNAENTPTSSPQASPPAAT